MSAPRKPDAATLARQALASDPARSAWVSAHAGSGKTHVLASRVVRLLLDGVAPARILCLTFTKAAAANMGERVFSTLARWATADDAALAELVARTGAGRSVDLTTARKLFARAVETPGGLKIQTIHAFCERVLHQFPFEANAPADFEALDDLQRAELLERARSRALARLANGDERQRRALETVASGAHDEGFVALVDEMLARRDILAERTMRERLAILRDALGLAPGDTLARVRDEILDGGAPRNEWASVAAAAATGSKQDKDFAARLLRAASAPDPDAALEALFDVYLTFDKAVCKTRSRLVTKAVETSHPALAERLRLEAERVFALRPRWLAAKVFERTQALEIVCGEAIEEYERAKQAASVLDFEDLIQRTRDLLTRAHVAQWVLFKLDGGVDHILVDEAQDTSEPQWRILEALAQEFVSGEGRPRRPRTFFAVGDEKQSIFSFQGAAPSMFDAMRREFQARAGNDRPFDTVPLHLSFRSAPEILAAVDAVFADEARRKGLSADAAAPSHDALKRGLPGLVEIWPKLAGTESEAPGEWILPVDAQASTSPSVILARKVAETIRRLVDPARGEAVEGAPGEWRAVTPGDVMVLVRRRDGFFEAIIRALKDAGVPVAGADRLDVAGHIAVMDCLAAARVALLPDDDLTLATVLKSPFVGLDDDDLIAIAPRRTGSLHAALAASAEPRHAAALARIETWRELAAHARPFDFFMTLLAVEGGRRALVARLGAEAHDALDEFLALALSHERAAAPSLTAFLAAMDDLQLNVKRDLEGAGDAVRVMTVHAAKGLEAKVVFLPDTCGAPTGLHDPKLYAVSSGEGQALGWTSGKANDPPALLAARERRREEQENEYRRLLYVAMTRAEERLYVAGWYNRRRPPAICWHDMITAALAERAEAAPDPLDPAGEVLRFGRLPPPLAPAAGADAALEPRLPEWLTAPAPREREAEPPLTPSSALSGADLVSRDGARAAAKARGTAAHALLRRLPDVPRDERREAGLAMLAGAAVTRSEHAGLVDRVLAAIDHPALAPAFAEGSLAEVAVAARLPRDDRAPLAVSGQIDRFAEAADAVHVVEFKTGALPAKGPPQAHVAQVALYAAALARLYPGRALRAALVYLAGPDVVALDDAALEAAATRLLQGERGLVTGGLLDASPAGS